MSTEANKQAALRFFENLSASKVEAALALMADSAIWLAPGRFELSGPKTKAQFVELLGMMGAVMPDGMRVTIKGVTAEGDRVAIEAESYGELTNGRVYNNQYHFLIEVREGKIQNIREYADTLHARQTFIE
jgi:ketosteroid isomerase-like protein